MNNDSLKPIRVEENGSSLLIAGLSETYSRGPSAETAAQWGRLASHLGAIPGQRGHTTYGLCYDMDGGEELKYLCGVEVSDTEDLPDSFTHKRVPPQTYAVFVHEGSVATLPQTLDAISEWLPESDYEAPDDVDFFFERYDERFDPQAGTGVIEVWMPIEA